MPGGRSPAIQSGFTSSTPIVALNIYPTNRLQPYAQRWPVGVQRPLAFGDVTFYGTINQINLPGGQRTVDQWFNTSLFEKSSAKQLASDVRTFPKYFAGIRAPNQQQVNLSLIKTFAFRERVEMQFRAECHDILNHPDFDAPNMTVTGSSFGAITTQGSPSRQFQGALKLSF